MKDGVLRLLARLGLLRPAFRGYERLQALRTHGNVAAGDGLPVPPASLRVRVAWTGDAAWFLESGRLAAESITDALARHAAHPRELGSLLDFGCGCGRVTRRWVSLEGVDVVGSDTSLEAIDWCRRNLPFARFASNKLEPPLAGDAASFDAAYALSVFTHLPLDLQRAWSEELARVLRPGGLLLVTTHGRAYVERLGPEEQARFEEGEVVVRRQEVAGTNLCSAYHSEAALRDVFGGSFELLELVPEGALGNPKQDQAVLRRTR
jgi:SAM-dependent methyltransferase